MSLAEQLGMDTNGEDYKNLCFEIHILKYGTRTAIREFIKALPDSQKEPIRAHFNEWDRKRKKHEN